MSRRKRANLSVSLFPFLAVLVCAMGALIFLLIVTTQMIGDESARKQVVEEKTPPPEPPRRPSPFKKVDGYESPDPETLAAAPAFIVAPPKVEEPPTPKIVAPPPPDPNIELRRRIVALKALRDRHRDELAAEEAELRAAQAAVAAAKDELKQHEATLADLEAERKQAGELDESFRNERKALLLKIRESEQRLDELEKRRATAPSKYALVPYDGRQGTTRRPIFVECTEKGLRILPEDVQLAPPQLEGFTESYNPLLAGVRALNEYWNSQPSANDPNGPGKPYVLLVVRPEGSISYYMARKFLTNWEDSYGYELIEDDFAWEVPPADPHARRVLQRAIAEALTHRHDIVRKFAVKGSLGELSEFPDTDELTDTEARFQGGSSYASRFAAKNQRHRRRVSQRNTSPSGTSQRNTRSTPSRGTSSQGRGYGENGTGEGAWPGGNGYSPTLDRNAAGQPGGTVPSIAGRPTGFPGGGEGRVAEVPHRFLSPEDAASLGLRGNGSADGAQRTPGRGDSEDNHSGQFGGGPRLGGDDDAPRLTRDGGRTGGQVGENSGADGGDTMDEGQTQPWGGAAGPDQLQAGNLNSPPQNAQGNPHATTGRGGSAQSRTGNPGTRLPPNDSGRVTQNQTFGEGSPSQPSADVQISGTPTQLPPSGPNFQNLQSPDALTPPQSSTLSIHRDAHRSGENKSLSKRGWGLSRRSGIGIERIVNVVITPDRIQVGNLESAIALGRGETPRQVQRAVIADIDQHAKEWGVPPSGFYWLPLVRFHVHPSAVQTFRPIEKTLRDGGLTTKTTYMDAETTAGAKQEATR